MRPLVKVLRKQYPPLVSKKQHCQRQLYFAGVVCCPSTHQDRLSSAALGLLSTTARGKYGIQPRPYACYCVTLSRAGLHLTITTSEKRSDEWSGVNSAQTRRNTRKHALRVRERSTYCKWQAEQWRSCGCYLNLYDYDFIAAPSHTEVHLQAKPRAQAHAHKSTDYQSGACSDPTLMEPCRGAEWHSGPASRPDGCPSYAPVPTGLLPNHTRR